MAESGAGGGGGVGRVDRADLLAVLGHRWLTSIAVIGSTARTLLNDFDQLGREQVDSLLRSVIRHGDQLEGSVAELFSVLPRPAATDPAPAPVLDLRQGAVVSRCSCGWSSTPTLTAVMAGEEWDRHLRAAGAASQRHDVQFGLTSWPTGGAPRGPGEG